MGKHRGWNFPWTPISSQKSGICIFVPLPHHPSPVQHSLRLLVLPGASRSCHCLSWVSERALASKRLLFLPACATLFSVLREWKRHTRASLPSSGKELFQPKNVTANSVPHQLIQTEAVKILNKTVGHWSGHSLVLQSTKTENSDPLKSCTSVYTFCF